eukprot:205369-Pleurochrysis_carterae.AAC.1
MDRHNGRPEGRETLNGRSYWKVGYGWQSALQCELLRLPSRVSARVAAPIPARLPPPIPI